MGRIPPNTVQPDVSSDMPRRPRPWTRTPDALALWQGWRGAVTTAIVLLLGLVLALALSWRVEQQVVAPLCRAHAAAHGLTYVGIDTYGPRQEQTGPHCLFVAADGSEMDVWLQRIAPFLTDLWIGFATDVEIMAPLLAVLLACAWMALHRVRAGLRTGP